VSACLAPVDESPDYALLLAGGAVPGVPPLSLADDTLCARWHLMINPLYRVRRGPDGLRLRRRRAAHMWELEALTMLKVMPPEWTIAPAVVEAIRGRRMTVEVRRLLQAGVLLEVPEGFARSDF
jgi:hypothetical protein